MIRLLSSKPKLRVRSIDFWMSWEMGVVIVFPLFIFLRLSAAIAFAADGGLREILH